MLETRSFSHDVGRSQAGTLAFLCTAYVEDAEKARLRPVEGIDRCSRSVDGECCAISKHDWRSRKTGPGFPVRILRCRTHRRFFTVYPEGFTPYSRRRLAPLASTTRARTSESTTLSSRWGETVFSAALYGAEGANDDGNSRVPRNAAGRRRIERAGLLLGLAPETDERVAEVMAQCLGLPGLDHRVARHAFSRARTLAIKGAIIVSVLQVMPLAGALDSRLLGAGFLVGMWGRPALWDTRTSGQTFPSFGTPVALSPRGPPQGPNESVPAAPGFLATFPVHAEAADADRYAGGLSLGQKSFSGSTWSRMCESALRPAARRSVDIP